MSDCLRNYELIMSRYVRRLIIFLVPAAVCIAVLAYLHFQSLQVVSVKLQNRSEAPLNGLVVNIQYNGQKILEKLPVIKPGQEILLRYHTREVGIGIEQYNEDGAHSLLYSEYLEGGSHVISLPNDHLQGR